MKFIKLQEVLDKISISKSTYYREKDNLNLPEKIMLTGSFAVWSEEEIEAWMQKRMDDRHL